MTYTRGPTHRSLLPPIARSYLELLGSYKKLLAKRQDEVMSAKKRYEVGLEKLATTEESVAGMQVRGAVDFTALAACRRRTQALHRAGFCLSCLIRGGCVPITLSTAW